MNSAWLSKDKKEHTKLIIGETNLKKSWLSIKDCQLKICLFHHPIGWLKQFESESISLDLDQKYHIVITGHRHQLFARGSTNFKTKDYTIQIGNYCIYQNSHFFNGYMIIDLNIEDRSGQANIRLYDPDLLQFKHNDTYDFVLFQEKGYAEYSNPNYNLSANNKNKQIFDFFYW